MTGPVLGSMLGYWILFAGWRWTHGVMALMAAANWILLICLVQETYTPYVPTASFSDARAIQKKLQYRIKHPLPDVSGWARFSPMRIIHDRAWMREMVSRSEMRQAFGKAFSRPPRLLFGNPVALIFSLYYSYIYAVLYLFIVSLNLLFGAPPFSVPGLFSYQWPQSTVGLCYLGMTVGFGLSALTAATMQDRIYKHLMRKNGGVGQPEYRVCPRYHGGMLTKARAHCHRDGDYAPRPPLVRMDRQRAHALDRATVRSGRHVLRPHARLQLDPSGSLRATHTTDIRILSWTPSIRTRRRPLPAPPW